MGNLPVKHLESQGTPFVTLLDMKCAADSCENASTVLQDAATVFGTISLSEDLSLTQIKAIAATVQHTLETWSSIMLETSSTLKSKKG